MQIKRFFIAAALAATFASPTVKAFANESTADCAIGVGYLPVDVAMTVTIEYTSPFTGNPESSVHPSIGVGGGSGVSYTLPATPIVTIFNLDYNGIDLSDTSQFPNRPSVALYAGADASSTYNGSAHSVISLSNFGTAGTDSYGRYGSGPITPHPGLTNAVITSGIIPAFDSKEYRGSATLTARGGTGQP